MDLALKVNEKASAGAALQLRDPFTKLPMGEEGKPCRLFVAGLDSKQYKAWELAKARRNQEDAIRDRTGFRISVEQQRADALDALVAITLGWEHCSYEGESEFSPQLVRRMYECEDWVREQVDAFVTDRANFVGASKPT